jgi:hypothetical protein
MLKRRPTTITLKVEDMCELEAVLARRGRPSEGEQVGKEGASPVEEKKQRASSSSSSSPQ